MQTFDCGRFQFDFEMDENACVRKPIVMGILNMTPDSFSDGGQFQSLEHAVIHAETMIQQGAEMIDIGGESTRPGAHVVSLQEELDRVIPAIYAIKNMGAAVSVDTYKPEVMREAILAGADFINDVKGFASEAAQETVKNAEVGLCMMHMQNTPQTMQEQPSYTDVVKEVSDFLRNQAQALMLKGVKASRLVVDPGFGFGKTLAHNLELMRAIRKIEVALNLPVLVGVSRKSMIGAITGKPVEHRMAGSVSAALAAYVNGAKILRVHDVAETVDAIKVWQKIFREARMDSVCAFEHKKG